MSTYWNTTAILNLQQVIIRHSSKIILNYLRIILFSLVISQWAQVTVFAPCTTMNFILIPQNKVCWDSLVPLPMIKIDTNVYLLVCLVVFFWLSFFCSISIQSMNYFSIALYNQGMRSLPNLKIPVTGSIYSKFTIWDILCCVSKIELPNSIQRQLHNIIIWLPLILHINWTDFFVALLILGIGVLPFRAASYCQVSW